MKNAASRIGQERAELLIEIMGHQGLGWEGHGFLKDELETTRVWLGGKATTIYGGSYEIQNNIIAKQILGLLDHESLDHRKMEAFIGERNTALLTEEQIMVRDSARSWLQKNSPVGALRKLRDGGNVDGFDRAAWAEMAEMGRHVNPRTVRRLGARPCDVRTAARGGGAHTDSIPADFDRPDGNLGLASLRERCAKAGLSAQDCARAADCDTCR
jgi:hypothetical protein